MKLVTFPIFPYTRESLAKEGCEQATILLLREAGRVVTRERLVNAVLSRKFMPFDRSIDMHVSKVRRKLGDSDENGDHIKTIRGVGYMFARPAKVKSEGSEVKARK